MFKIKLNVPSELLTLAEDLLGRCGSLVGDLEEIIEELKQRLSI